MSNVKDIHSVNCAAFKNLASAFPSPLCCCMFKTKRKPIFLIRGIHVVRDVKAILKKISFLALF